MAAQDPAERFDLVDVTGEPLGRSKARAEVHRDGDWHRAMHLWLVHSERGVVYLARRSTGKDTNAGLVDVSVGGHLSAGETLEDALREADEELGVVVRWDQVSVLGRAWFESRAPGLWDREIVDVLCAEHRAGVEVMRPFADEVAEVLEVEVGDALALWAGRVAEVRALGWSPEAPRVRQKSLSRSEIVAPGDLYRRRALETLVARATGVAVAVPWTVGARGAG